jgi:DNA/RNA-binding domain of Phe-tRNA-synthetase-like protein
VLKLMLIVEDAFWALFPEAMIGVVTVRGIDNRRAAEETARLLAEQTEATAAALGDAEIGSHAAVAPWRAAYQRFGVKPSKTRSSIESLLRSAKAGRLREINPLVDLYNVVSLKHMLPCGGEDLSAISGALRLTRALGEEPFVPLGGSGNEPPPPGAVVYRDNIGVVCSCWNWREADRTKLTEATTGAILVIEALPPSTRAALEAACRELSDLIPKHLGGSAAIEIIARMPGP